MQHRYSIFRRKSLRTILTVAGSMSVAFFIGIQTAGEIRPVIGPTSAGTAVLAGDMNGNHRLDDDDVRIMIEIARGYRTATPDELAADPNQDFVITGDDILAVMEKLKSENER